MKMAMMVTDEADDITHSALYGNWPRWVTWPHTPGSAVTDFESKQRSAWR